VFWLIKIDVVFEWMTVAKRLVFGR